MSNEALANTEERIRMARPGILELEKLFKKGRRIEGMLLYRLPCLECPQIMETVQVERSLEHSPLHFCSYCVVCPSCSNCIDLSRFLEGSECSCKQIFAK